MLKAHSLSLESLESSINEMDEVIARLEKERKNIVRERAKQVQHLQTQRALAQQRRKHRSLAHIDFPSLSLEWKVAQFPIFCYGIYGFTAEDNGEEVELNKDASYWTFNLVNKQPFKLTDSLLSSPDLLQIVIDNRLVLTPVLMQRLAITTSTLVEDLAVELHVEDIISRYILAATN